MRSTKRVPVKFMSAIAAFAVLLHILTLQGVALADQNSNAILALAVDPSAGTVFKATGHGLYQSRDDGKNWKAVALPPGFGADDHIVSIAIPADGNGKIYLSVADRGVFRTTDSGAHWQLLTKGLPEQGRLNLAAHSTLPKTLYAVAAQKSIYRSLDSGTSWQRMDEGPGTILHLVHTNMKGSMQTGWLFAATSNGVQRGMDCFCLWRRAGDLKGPIIGISYNPKKPKHVTAISAGGLFQSRDGGETWDRTAPPA
jgi:photosystem II stability/assembly factor-like uncharacterized protein